MKKRFKKVSTIKIKQSNSEGIEYESTPNVIRGRLKQKRTSTLKELNVLRLLKEFKIEFDEKYLL
jgi:hypothetical protein